MPFATKARIPDARRALVKPAGLLAGVREHAADQHDPRQPSAQLFDLRGHGRRIRCLRKPPPATRHGRTELDLRQPFFAVSGVANQRATVTPRRSQVVEHQSAFAARRHGILTLDQPVHGFVVFVNVFGKPEFAGKDAGRRGEAPSRLGEPRRGHHEVALR